jgi:hypothetical protein
MTVFAPAHVRSNAPVVSLAALTEPRGLAGATTIPFKNVLDALETASDENVPVEQRVDSQSTTSKKAAHDATPGLQPLVAPQQGALQIPFPAQDLAKLAAELAAPAQEAAEPPQKSPEGKTIAPQSSKAYEQDHPDSTLAENAPPPGPYSSTLKSLRSSTETVPSETLGSLSKPTALSTPRFGASVQAPMAPATSAPAKSGVTEAKIATAPALVATVVPAASKTVPEQAHETIPEPGSAAPDLHEAHPAAPSHATSLPSIVPALPKSASTTSNDAHAAKVPTAKTVSMSENPPAAAPASTGPEAETSEVTAPAGVTRPQAKSTMMASSQLLVTRSANAAAANMAAVTPRDARESVAGSVADEISTKLAEPVRTAGFEVKSRATETKPRTMILPKSQSMPELGNTSPPVVARTQIAEPSTPVITTPQSVSAKPKETSPRRISALDSAPAAEPASDSRGAQNQPSEPKPAANPSDAAAAQTVTLVAPVPVPAETTRSASEAPEPLTAPRKEFTEAAVATAAAPKPPLTPRVENLAFAVRMLAPDNAPNYMERTQTKSVVTLAEPSLSQTKPPVSLPKPAPAAQFQQPQSQASSNPKRETQAPASAPEKADVTHAATAPGAPRTDEMTGTIPRWSEVNASQPSEIASSSISPSELAEPVHTNPALAVQETHLMTPDLPKPSTSTGILLHLAANDQSSAAIRVTDRAGAVNVSVHASDPVLRESLRSNLGELSNQLGNQGWKAEMLKPAAIAAQSDNQQDSHPGGQRFSQHQQSFGGDRQPQRDRRAPGGRWDQEFEQQISGGDAHPGGNG